MPKQKYYYAVVDKETGELISTTSVLPIYKKKFLASDTVKYNSGYKVLTIPADSLHKLIKEHTKKAK